MELDNWVFIGYEERGERGEEEESVKTNGRVYRGQWLNLAGRSEVCLFCPYLMLPLTMFIHSFHISKWRRMMGKWSSQGTSLCGMREFDEICTLYVNTLGSVVHLSHELKYLLINTTLVCFKLHYIRLSSLYKHLLDIAAIQFFSPCNWTVGVQVRYVLHLSYSAWACRRWMLEL